MYNKNTSMKVYTNEGAFLMNPNERKNQSNPNSCQINTYSALIYTHSVSGDFIFKRLRW